MFGSLTKTLDILKVEKDLKKVSRVLLSDSLLEYLDEKKIPYVLSDFKIDTGDSSYTEQGVVGEIGVPFVYISKEKTFAEKAKKLEEKGKHKELGILLGYPPCCCSFFEKYNSKASGRDFTPYSFLESSRVKHSFLLNNCLRSFDISLLSHFPCSYDCKESIDKAKETLALLKDYDKEKAEEWKTALRAAILYIEDMGVYAFSDFTFDNHVLEYNPKKILATNKNDFFRLLTEKNRIRVLGEHQFLVGETLVEDERTHFGVFL